MWLFTITAPGQKVLPWGPDGRVEDAAAERWNAAVPANRRDLHQAAAQQTRRALGHRPTVLAWVMQLQERGVLHVHLIVGLATAKERAAAHRYLRELCRLARHHGFGYVDRGKWDPETRKRVLREMTGKHAGRYAAKYLVPGRDSAGAYKLSEVVTHPQAPPRIVYVCRRLTDATGVTMRSLREHRVLVASGQICPLSRAELLALLTDAQRATLGLVDAANAPPAA